MHFKELALALVEAETKEERLQLLEENEDIFNDYIEKPNEGETIEVEDVDWEAKYHELFGRYTRRFLGVSEEEQEEDIEEINNDEIKEEKTLTDMGY